MCCQVVNHNYDNISVNFREGEPRFHTAPHPPRYYYVGRACPEIGRVDGPVKGDFFCIVAIYLGLKFKNNVFDYVIQI
jgi:hypothetical protein